ncbi:hypothetical protein BWI93_12610 [Siphonobacter sp. BAB-5385]|uniref:sce7726 family protein n=1 Tax=Siphonobacter sp. BAB-5385 TaxID=1864822 RepID=UPI000B9EAECB|nr:sce7726 family protein [Siphonobacter sp. BAB-5385]OZI07804.1 hypothetical protein BWI93_12610 [Siphonobacter sp. BAB-5385]
MRKSSSISTANLNALSKLVSNAGFKRLVNKEDYKSYGIQIKNLLKASGKSLNKKHSINDLINISYEHLLANYRYEYLYKLVWLNEYVLRNYSLSDTVILNEFKINSSIADIILVNGTNKVFEIKTELDSPERLKNQINDYYKAFSEVYIIIHHSDIEKYIHIVDENVGIMIFSSCNSIKLLRNSRPVNHKLDSVVMAKALRKDEFLAMTKNLLGYIPIVKPVMMFKTCMAEISKLPPEKIQQEFLKAIKNRINLNTNDLINTQGVPNILKFSCYLSNISTNNYKFITKHLKFQL